MCIAEKMQALRALMTPETSKRQKVEHEDFEPDEDHELLEEEQEDDHDDQPEWAKRQEARMMMNIQHMFQEVQDDVHGLKQEIDHIKLQSEVALSRAEESMEKAEAVEEMMADMRKNTLDIVKVRR